MKEGPVHIFNEEALSKNQPIFIVEGEIDAMSIMETGKAEAIGLGSVANINIFMKALYKAKKARKDDFYPTLLIALDNDDAGNRAINKLTTQLNQVGVTNYVVQIARGSKDANEALVKGRSLGFASTTTDYTPCSDSLSLRLRTSLSLTLPVTVTRRFIMQKARRHFLRSSDRL